MGIPRTEYKSTKDEQGWCCSFLESGYSQGQLVIQVLSSDDKELNCPLELGDQSSQFISKIQELWLVSFHHLQKNIDWNKLLLTLPGTVTCRASSAAHACNPASFGRGAGPEPSAGQARAGALAAIEDFRLDRALGRQLLSCWIRSEEPEMNDGKPRNDLETKIPQYTETNTKKSNQQHQYSRGRVTPDEVKKNNDQKETSGSSKRWLNV